MSKNINLVCDDKALLVGAAELASDLGLRLTSSGVTVNAVKGTELSVRKNGEGYVLTYRRKHEFFRGLSLIRDAVAAGADHVENGKYDMLCYMADVSRNAVLSMDGAKEMIRVLAAMGYDSLMLYAEDTYEVPEYPYFGRMRGRYSADELRGIDDYADMFGIEVIPCIQTLAHLATAIRWPGLNSFTDCNDIMLVGDERTYDFIRACLKACRSVFRSKRINIGMDEAHMLGRGKYLTLNGYRPAHEIMLEHLDRVAKMCAEVGYEPMMWSDMFFRMAFGGAYRVREGEIAPEIMAKVPANVTLVYWDYYSLDRQIFDHMVECHQKFNNPVIFAGGAWKWSGFAPHNAFSLASTKLQLDSCAEHGLGSVIVTGWGDNGAEASQFSTLPALTISCSSIFPMRCPVHLPPKCRIPSAPASICSSTIRLRDLWTVTSDPRRPNITKMPPKSCSHTRTTRDGDTSSSRSVCSATCLPTSAILRSASARHILPETGIPSAVWLIATFPRSSQSLMHLPMLSVFSGLPKTRPSASPLRNRDSAVCA